MGLDTASVKFCGAARSLGVDFGRTLTLGRQGLFPAPRSLQRVFDALGIDRNARNFLSLNQYGEDFLALLGAREVDSMDYSDYEGATVIHDMNQPVPDALKERFTVVYDGGTLEHVFHVTQALRNCMEMVAPGGHFLQANVANNFMGHGFWQFSPELLFRVFSPANGFQVKLVLLHEITRGGRWYRASDPDKVRQRVTLRNAEPTYILTIARKIASTEICSSPPLQSDYSAIWRNQARENGPDSVAASRATRRTGSRIPVWARDAFRPLQRAYGAINRRAAFASAAFQEIPEDDLLRGTIPGIGSRG